MAGGGPEEAQRRAGGGLEEGQRNDQKTAEDGRAKKLYIGAK